MSIKEISREEFASYILQSPCSKDDSLRVQDSFGSEAEYCASRNYIHGPLPKEPVYLEPIRFTSHPHPLNFGLDIEVLKREENGSV